MDARKLVSLGRLGLRYAGHQARRVRGGRGSELSRFLDIYRADGLAGTPTAARRDFPRFGNCLSCGLCSFAIAPETATSIWHLPVQLTRSFPELHLAAHDSRPWSAAQLRAAEAVCPAGVPFRRLAAFISDGIELMEAAVPEPPQPA